MKIAAGIATSFTGLVATIVFLLAREIVTVQMALLMLVALVAMYVGFGVLIALWRLVGKLD